MMKGQKGITLVALIITIIVMLILVGVSIAFAVNTDMFGRADTAVTKTKAEQVREAITLAKADIVGAYYDATAPVKAVKTAEEVQNAINAYLDSSMEVSVARNTPAAGEAYTYTVTAPEGVTLTDAEKVITFTFFTAPAAE